MDRRRMPTRVSSPQFSGQSSSSGSSSPVHQQSWINSANVAGGPSTVKQTNNVALKTAAQRLAQVMAFQSTPDDDEEADSVEFQFRGPPGSTAISGNSGSNGPLSGSSVARWIRSPSPTVHRQFLEHSPSSRSNSTGRAASAMRLTGSTLTSARRSDTVPSIEPLSRSNRRVTEEIGQIKGNNMGDQREVFSLRDELDMLHKENEVMLEKLRDAEERREKAEARSQFLEKQVADLGEGLSMEAEWLSRKEEAFRRRDEAFRAAEKLKEERAMEITALRSKCENLKEEASTDMGKLHKAESEAKALRSMTQTLILTREEMEEVILKRCWLARYWRLAVQLGICTDIAVSKHEYWSAFAPLPFEVVASSGQKAREEVWEKGAQDLTDLSSEGNFETMLSVETGLRELAALKIEDAVFHALGQHRRQSLVHQSISDSKQPGDLKFMEAFELSKEEAEDVLFKEAWLAYFWRRAKEHGVEKEIAEERLRFWISRRGQLRTSHDAVDVERGLYELRKLGIEQKLWAASQRELDLALAPIANNHETVTESYI